MGPLKPGPRVESFVMEPVVLERPPLGKIDGVFFGVARQLVLDGLSQVDVKLVSQSNQIDEHVGDLFLHLRIFVRHGGQIA